ncbi:LPS translocon maturation chaperone LptM [Thermomonas hydrothermalis]|jgi:predicted small lipoprotein YifL|uniref:Lipoprotein-attachment site-containing protein n=1 Tax=Thermomonas hydrothermalis TaxID=213588 RepID=A0A1M4WKC5_9GAMM|nr:lipoprotein [Thermomonas hydrothermalis]MCL6619045.1 lipoprotein [Thermomonas hydrothermalis]SHE81513.1 lipoprotein-attachment site-containing protein [Thermomonas hydrothermalis]
MTKRFLLLALLITLLSACGNKGPLVLPDKTPPAPASQPSTDG